MRADKRRARFGAAYRPPEARPGPDAFWSFQRMAFAAQRAAEAISRNFMAAAESIEKARREASAPDDYTLAG